jgi:hypothetical protein
MQIRYLSGNQKGQVVTMDNLVEAQNAINTGFAEEVKEPARRVAPTKTVKKKTTKGKSARPVAKRAARSVKAKPASRRRK